MFDKEAYSDTIGYFGDEFFALVFHNVHRHLARDELDADGLGHLEQVLGLRHVVLLGQPEETLGWLIPSPPRASGALRR